MKPFAHNCPNWDFLRVAPGDPEMESCTCFPKQELKKKMKKNHQDRLHALLSPSAAKRWITCPGSVIASEGIYTPPSEAALEGTKAHEWAEVLRKKCATGNPKEYKEQLENFSKHDDEMAFHCDNYIDFLDKLKSKFVSPKFDDYEEFLESKVHFTENIWGTLDFAIIRKGPGGCEAIIADFKYGRGTYVPVQDNPQLIIYLIALENKLETRFDRAWIYIYQPRIPKDKPYEMMKITRKEVTAWRHKILVAEGIVMGMKAKVEPLAFEAGDHCQFCPFQPQCPTFRAHADSGNLQILNEAPSVELPNVEAIPIETLVQIHKKKKQIEHFLENVDHFLLMRGLNKQDIGDLKIVEGRSTRRWIDDEEKVAAGLRDLRVEPYKQKLINIGDVEKKIGKGLIDHLTTKPSGKLQLALPDDERPTAQLGKDALALLD